MTRTLTRRDRANAMTGYAFRNGHIESLHAGRSSELDTNRKLAKFTRTDLQAILRESSSRIVELLCMRDEEPEKLRLLVTQYCDTYVRSWIRSPRCHIPAEPLLRATSDLPQRPSLEEEGRAIACYSFIDGFLSRWHKGEYSPLLEDSANSRISDADMASLMIDSSERLAGCLALRHQNLKVYHQWVHRFQANVDAWLEDGPLVAIPRQPSVRGSS